MNSLYSQYAIIFLAVLLATACSSKQTNPEQQAPVAQSDDAHQVAPDHPNSSDPDKPKANETNDFDDTSMLYALKEEFRCLDKRCVCGKEICGEGESCKNGKCSLQEGEVCKPNTICRCGNNECTPGESCINGACSLKNDETCEYIRCRCEQDTCMGGEVCSNGKCFIQSGHMCMGTTCTCGVQECAYGEMCENGKCVIYASDGDNVGTPQPLTGTVIDSEHFWECTSESCLYKYQNSKYTIPKGIRILNNYAFCGGDIILVSQINDYACTEVGWLCTGKQGCECKQFETANKLICSPGEKCNSVYGCSFVGVEPKQATYCRDGNCKCGSRACGKGQTCFNDECWFAGKKWNDADYKDCTFSADYDICKPHDPPSQFVRYSCPKTCKSLVPPENKKGYAFVNLIVYECAQVVFGQWICTDEAGCACGKTKCEEGDTCVEGRCATPAVVPDATKHPKFANECGDEYLDYK